MVRMDCRTWGRIVRNPDGYRDSALAKTFFTGTERGEKIILAYLCDGNSCEYSLIVNIPLIGADPHKIGLLRKNHRSNCLKATNKGASSFDVDLREEALAN